MRRHGGDLGPQGRDQAFYVICAFGRQPVDSGLYIVVISGVIIKVI